MFFTAPAIIGARNTGGKPSLMKNGRGEKAYLFIAQSGRCIHIICGAASAVITVHNAGTCVHSKALYVYPYMISMPASPPCLHLLYIGGGPA
jgi:hypothetical protein